MHPVGLGKLPAPLVDGLFDYVHAIVILWTYSIVRIDQKIPLVTPEVEDRFRCPVRMAELLIEVVKLTELPARGAQGSLFRSPPPEMHFFHFSDLLGQWHDRESVRSIA